MPRKRRKLRFESLENRQLLASADVVVGTTVVAEAPPNIGAAWQGNHVNTIGTNPGFEGVNVRWNGTATGGGDDYILNEDGGATWFYDVYGDGFFNGATVRVYRVEETGVVKVREDTVAYYHATDPDEGGDCCRIDLASSGPPVQAGDIYYLDHSPANIGPAVVPDRIPDSANIGGISVGTTFSPSEFITAVRDDTTFAPVDGGKVSLRIDATADEPVYFRGYGNFDTRPGTPWYTIQPNETYHVSVWLKQEGVATGEVRFQIPQQWGDVNVPLDVTSQWQQFTFDYTLDNFDPTVDLRPQTALLRYDGPGTLWVDNYVISNAASPPLSVYPEVRQALIDAKLGQVRLHSASGHFGDTTLESWTNPPVLNEDYYRIAQTQVPTEILDLPVTLPILRDAGSDPWLIISTLFSDDEWDGLVEYLAAPYDPADPTHADRVWARKRYEQGQQTPWIDEFGHIFLELGIETWSPGSFPRTYPDGETYGKFADYFYNIVASSPYYDADKFEFMLGGWAIQPGETGYGAQAAANCSLCEYNMTTNYIGGWEAGVALGGDNVNDVGFQETLVYSPRNIFGQIDAHAVTRDALAQQGVHYELGAYEGGPGYSLPGQGNGSVEAAYGHSLAAGVASLDAELYFQYQDAGVQAYYKFADTNSWSTHTYYADGFRPHPSFLAIQMRNNYASGDMLMAATIDGPAIDVEQTGNQPESQDIPLIQPYVYRDGDTYSVFVLSRDLDETHDVTLHLPFDSAASTSLYRITGDPRDSNLDTMNIDIEQVAGVPNATSDEYTFPMPPGSVYVYVFEGTTTNAPTDPAVIINQIPGQEDATDYPVVQYNVLFSEPVTSFDAGDVQIDSVVPPQDVRVEAVPGSEGTMYRVILDGFDGATTVTATVPAGVAQAIDDGAGNLASTSLDNVVEFIPRVPQDIVFLHDDFGHDPNAGPLPPGIEGVETGYGFATRWDDRTGYAPPDNHQLSDVQPLTYANLQTTPTYADVGFYRSDRQIDVHANFADFERFDTFPRTIGQSGTTLWASALLRKDTASNNPVLVRLVDGPLNWGGGENELSLSFGYGGSYDVGGVPHWGMSVRNDSEYGGGDDFDAVGSDVPVVDGEAALLVLKMEFGSQDTISLYVNPDPATLGGAEPATPNATYTTGGVNDIRFRTLDLLGGNLDNRRSIDEIRIGDSYAAVTETGPPIPQAPVLQAADAGATTRVIGRIDNDPDTTYTLDFVASSGAGFEPADTRLLHTTNITTDATGMADFDLVIPAATTAGEFVAATATSPATATSALSDGVTVISNDPPVANDDTYATAADAVLTLPGSSYADAVLADNPITYWRIGETGTTAANSGSTAGAADGTYVGTPERGTGLVGIGNDGAPHFDGTNDRVEIPETPGLNTGGPFAERTIELWFKANSFSGRQVLYELGGRDRGMSVYLSGNELYAAAWNIAGPTDNWNIRSISTPVELARTYHVAVVMQGNETATGTLTGYLDGVEFDQSAGVGELWEPTGDGAIGFQNGPGRYHNGTIAGNPVFDDLAFLHGTVDEVAVYNAALTTEQLAAHITAAGVLGNDVDIHAVDTISITAFDTTSRFGGTVSVNADGSFTYDPTTSTDLANLPENEIAHDTFTYTISDGYATSTATVTIEVSGLAPVSHPCADLCGLHDEFNDPTKIADWQRIYQVEGWDADQLEAWDIDTTQAGRMTMIPWSVTWFQDYRGPMAFKEVTGDFSLTTEVYIHDRDEIGDSDADDVPDGAQFSLAGPLIRTPRPEITSPADWTPGGEDWSFLSLGYGTSGSNFNFEVKSTNNSQSNLRLSNAGTAGTAKLQITRIGDAVIALHKLPGEDWVVHQRYRRADLPETLQVGLVTYSDYVRASQLSYFNHNNTAITDGNRDLVAGFEYARYARPRVILDLQGVDLVNDASDEDLLRFLGEPLDVPAPNDGIVTRQIMHNGHPLAKTPLLPGGTASFNNYTSYVGGITNITIDIADLPAAVTASDFAFRIGNDDDPSTWTTSPTPSITTDFGTGTGNSDRITLDWPDGAIRNTWLQVTVLANANTGLNTDDIFYFGSTPGESGDAPSHARVNAFDFAGARDNAGTTAPAYDFNLDGNIDGTDLAIARDNATNFNTALQLITPTVQPLPQQAMFVEEQEDTKTTEDSEQTPLPRFAPVQMTSSSDPHADRSHVARSISGPVLDDELLTELALKLIESGENWSET